MTEKPPLRIKFLGRLAGCKLTLGAEIGAMDDDSAIINMPWWIPRRIRMRTANKIADSLRSKYGEIEVGESEWRTVRFKWQRDD